jgi:MFS family permease
VLLIGLLAVAIAPLCYIVTTSVPLLFVLRAFHGLSIAAFTTAFSALVTDISPPQNRGEIVGYMTLVNPIGVAVGPALGGFLLEWFDYTPMFLTSAGLGVVGILCVLRLKAPAQGAIAPADGTAQPAAGMPFWEALLSPRLRIPALVLTMIGMVFGTLSTFVPLFIQETGVNLNPGLFYTAAAISSFGARLLTGKASDRLGRGRFITGSIVLYAVSMFILWTAHTSAEFLIAGFIEGAGGGIFIPMMIVLTADRSTASERGRIFGLCLVGFDLGMAISGSVLGGLVGLIGYRGLFGVAGCLASLGLVIFMTQSSKNLAYSLKFSLGRGKDIYALPYKG